MKLRSTTGEYMSCGLDTKLRPTRSDRQLRNAPTEVAADCCFCSQRLVSLRLEGAGCATTASKGVKWMDAVDSDEIGSPSQRQGSGRPPARAPY